MEWNTETVRRFNTLGDLPEDLRVTTDSESNMIAFEPGQLDEGVLWIDKWQAKRLARRLLEIAQATGKP